MALRRTLPAHEEPDGTVWYEQVPLKQRDLLFPEEGDRPVLNNDHTTDYVYLLSVLKQQTVRHPGRRVFGDHRIDFEVPDLKPLGPDLIVLDGVGDWDGSRGTFPVRTMGADPLLAIEITSPDSRKYDLGIKLRYYFRCGIRCYAIVDRQPRDGSRASAVAYQAGAQGFDSVAPDSRGRVRLEPVGLWLGIVDGRAVCYDRRGRRIAPPQEQAAEHAKAQEGRKESCRGGGSPPASSTGE